MATPSVITRKTRAGFRLSQHGVVLSELRTTPGPTHSVFDVLAAVAALLRPEGRIGVLGFAGGGLLAPLRALGATGAIHGVDLDGSGYQLFRAHCRDWAGGLEWTRADAVDWLCDRIEPFDVLIDDLSIPVNGDVIKPEVSWTILPELIRSRLAPAGVAVLNLLKPENESWSAGLARVAGVFREALMIELDDFQNRIVVAGAKLPDARALSTGLRASLKGLRSRQATRLRLRTLA